MLITGIILLIIGIILIVFQAIEEEFSFTSYVSGILCLLGALSILAYNHSNNETKDKVIIAKYYNLNNSIIKSNYNYNINTFNIIYVEDNDTLALDDLHPSELDSLINKLNK